MKEKNKEIIDAVDRALVNYSSANVDVIRDEERNTLDVFYHSRHNSFPIETTLVDYDDIDIKALEIELDERGVGYCF